MTQDTANKSLAYTDRDYTALLADNLSLQAENKRLLDYVREKTNEMLQVMGTIPLKPEELDNTTLIEFDPIGIVAQSFKQVIDNLRQTNQKLQLAHQEIQAIFDSVGAAVLVLDPHRKIVAYNKNSQKKLFPGTDDFTGQYCKDVVCENRLSDHNCVHNRIIASGQPEKYQDWKFQDYSFDVIGQPIKNDSGEVTHVVVAYIDVTEHRKSALALQRALAEMQEAKGQIDGLLKSMSDGFIATDAKGRVVLMNPAAEKLLETSFGHCLGKPLADITSIPSLKIHFRELVSGGTNYSCDFDLKCPDGMVKTYQARSSMMSNDGMVSGRLTFLQDVNREREIDRMKDEFLSTAAHQLRTPLASVIGFSELIMNSKSLDEATRKDYISMIYGKAEQLSEIVSNLLDISRIEAGSGPVVIQNSVRVDDLIEEALTGFRKSCLKHNFEVNLQQDDVLLNIDRFAMLQVLENLLSNAVKYSPDGGVVQLEGFIEDDHYRLSVIDSGLGMNDEQAAQAFEKFYRADASNTAISGTGLGLTIVRHLVEAHDGTVCIETRPGAGTAVHLTLPLYS